MSDYSVEDRRAGDPRDKRSRVEPIVLDRPRDPIDRPYPAPPLNVPNARAGDTLDARPLGSPHMGIVDTFTLPSPAITGQTTTNPNSGITYTFDGLDWFVGDINPVASTYTFRIGIDETSPGIVDVMPATALGEIGGINEPTTNGMFLRNAAGTTYSWVPATAGTAYIWGVALTENPVGTINVDPATNAIIGGIMEPPADGQFVRSAVGTTYTWVPVAAGGLTFDTGLTLTGTSVNLDPALPPGGEIGGINEPPADDGKQYTRSYTAGAGIWTEMTGGGYTFGIGLDEVPPGSMNVDLLPATPAVIGGVSVVARSNVQGLDLAATGALTAPLATDLLAGSIVEPLPDGLQYVRTRTVAGVSSWVVATTASLIWGIGIDEDLVTPGTIHLQPANFTPGEIGGIVADVRSLTQGLLLDDVTGLLTAPLATDLLAGAIVEPLPDGLVYGRSRDLLGVSTWKPVTAVFIGDAPPPAPTVGLFWYDSDTGRLYLFVDDGNSQQFVQVGGV